MQTKAAMDQESVRRVLDKSRYLTEKQVVDLFPFAISHDTLRKWRSTDRGPQYFRFGRGIFYTEADVAEWLELQKKGSNHDRKKRAADLLPVRVPGKAGAASHRLGPHRCKSDDYALPVATGTYND